MLWLIPLVSACVCVCVRVRVVNSSVLCTHCVHVCIVSVVMLEVTVRHLPISKSLFRMTVPAAIFMYGSVVWLASSCNPHFHL